LYHSTAATVTDRFPSVGRVAIAGDIEGAPATSKGLMVVVNGQAGREADPMPIF
jgi:hypothetical protein